MRAGTTALVLAVLAGALTWWTFLAPDERTPAAHHAGRIVFVRQTADDPGPMIAVMEPDDSETRILAEGSDPAWSPDGSRIAFSAAASGAGRSADIFVMNADGTGVHRLTANPEGVYDEGPSWSPDGRHVVFSRSVLDLSGPDPVASASRRDLYTVRVADGRGLTELVGGPTDDFEPTWSPDGSLIAFVRIGDGSEPGATPAASQIWIVQADGTAPTPVTTLEQGSWRPAWSPDGASIAFDDDDEIHVVGLDGEDPRRVANGFDPAWSPDGAALVFARGSDGDNDLYAVDLDGELVPRLTDGPANDASPAWGTTPPVTPSAPPSPSPSPFEPEDVFASGEAAGSRWVLVDTGVLLVLYRADGAELASVTDAPDPTSRSRPTRSGTSTSRPRSRSAWRPQRSARSRWWVSGRNRSRRRCARSPTPTGSRPGGSHSTIGSRTRGSWPTTTPRFPADRGSCTTPGRPGRPSAT